MEKDQFSRQIEIFRSRLGSLAEQTHPSTGDPEPLSAEVMDELDQTLEELHASEEELRQQNEELVAARAAVEVERQRYQDLFEFAPDGYLVTDAYGSIREANRASAELLNVSQFYLAGKSLVNFVPDEDRQALRLRLIRLAEVEREPYWEIRLKPRQGEPRAVAMAATAVRDRGGELVGVRWLIRDMTERKRIEDGLRRAYEELEARVRARTAELDETNAALLLANRQLTNILESISDGFFTLDDRLVITYFNRAAEQLLRRASADVLGRNMFDAFPEFKASPFDENYTWALREQRDLSFEIYFGIPPLENWYDVRVYPFENGLSVYFQVTTERRKAEEALRQQARELAALEERQRLARELHDSVSQSIYGIVLGARTARDLIEQGDGRAKGTVDYILSLAKTGLSDMRALIFDLRPETLANEGLVAALAKRASFVEHRQGIKVRTEFCEEPDAPLSVKDDLYRIAREALHNAIKHARAKNVDLRLKCGGDSVFLEVADDGVGFNPAGPEPGHLGLQSMRERAAHLGGSLEIDSAPGEGTRVRLRVPHVPHAEMS